MNIQEDQLLNMGKLYTVWNVKQDMQGFGLPRVNYFECEKVTF